MKIRYFATVRDLTGEIEIQWDKPTATLRELLLGLSERYGSKFHQRVWKEGDLGQGIIVLINGRDARQLGGTEATLSPEDTVFFLAVAGGGSGRMMANKEERQHDQAARITEASIELLERKMAGIP